MILDIIAFAAVILAGIFYARRGFAATIISALSWVAVVVLEVLFCQDAAAWISRETPIDETIQKFAAAHIREKGASKLEDALPDAANKLLDRAADTAAEHVTSLIMLILALLLILIAVKLIAWLLKKFFTDRDRRGFIGGVDTAAGLIVGLLIGVFYAMIIFCLLKLLLGFFPGPAETWIQQQLGESSLRELLIDRNIVLMIIREVLHL